MVTPGCCPRLWLFSAILRPELEAANLFARKVRSCDGDPTVVPEAVPEMSWKPEESSSKVTLEGALLLKNLPDPAPMTLLDVMETSSVDPELEKWSWASGSGIVIFMNGLGDTTVEQSMNKLYECTNLRTART